MQDLKEILKKYYESKSMPEDKVEYLLYRSSTADRLSFARYIAYAALASALILVSVFIYNSVESRNLTNRVLAEIAMNHNKQLNVDVAADDYRVLDEKMNKLDFSIPAPDRTLLGGYELLGGRYCSLNGHLAAQLKVRDKKDGQILTLYVTKLNDDLKRVNQKSYYLDDTEIRLWTQGDILFALARNDKAL